MPTEVTDLDHFHLNLIFYKPYIGRTGGRYFKGLDSRSYRFNDLIKLYERAVGNIVHLTDTDFETMVEINITLKILDEEAEELRNNSSLPVRMATKVRHTIGARFFDRKDRLSTLFYFLPPTIDNPFGRHDAESVKDVQTIYFPNRRLDDQENKPARNGLRRNAREESVDDVLFFVDKPRPSLPFHEEESSFDKACVLGLNGRWETHSSDGSCSDLEMDSAESGPCRKS